MLSNVKPMSKAFRKL